MRKFKYNGYEFEIGLIKCDRIEYILTQGKDLPGNLLESSPFSLFIGNTYNPVRGQIVVKNEPLLIRRDAFDTMGDSYLKTMEYLENLCNPKPLTLDDIRKECEGKSPEEIIVIMSKYEYRAHFTDNTWSNWSEFASIEFCRKEVYELGTRQLRRKEGN